MATRTKGFVTMTRILLIVAAVAVLLGAGGARRARRRARPELPAASSCPSTTTSTSPPAITSTRWSSSEPNASVEGTVDSIVVVDGTATLTAATAGSVVVMNGTADLQAGTRSRRRRTFDGTVNRAADAVVPGLRRAPSRPTSRPSPLLLIPLFIRPVRRLRARGDSPRRCSSPPSAPARSARRRALISHEPGHRARGRDRSGSFVLPLLAVLVTDHGRRRADRPRAPCSSSCPRWRSSAGSWRRSGSATGSSAAPRGPRAEPAVRRRGGRGHRPRARRHRPVRQRHRDAVRVRRPARDGVADPPPAHGHGRLGRPGSGAAQRELGAPGRTPDPVRCDARGAVASATPVPPGVA